MLKYIFKQWQRKPLGVVLIIVGYIIGILVLSIGLSSIEMTKNDLGDMYSGNPDDYSIVRVNTLKNTNIDSDKIISFFNDLSATAEVQILNFNKVKVAKQNVNYDYPLVPIIFNKPSQWHIPIIQGRYFYKDEASLSSHKIIIGKEIAAKLSIVAGKDKVTINNEVYDVIGISGREYKETQWDNYIYMPLNALPESLKVDFISRVTENKNGANTLNLSFLIRKNKSYIENMLNEKVDLTFPQSESFISYTNLDKVSRSSIDNTVFLTITASAVILIITIINVVNLSLFWILDRRKQLAIMMSIGATGRRICKEVIMEMLLMSIISSLIAVVIQKVLFIIFKNYLITNGVYFDVSWTNLIISIVVGAICGLISSVFPVIATLKVNPSEALHFQ